MDLHETSLLATSKTVSAFASNTAATFPPLNVGGQQFALVTAVVPGPTTLGRIADSKFNLP
jgi:hypothetical protein